LRQALCENCFAPSFLKEAQMPKKRPTDPLAISPDLQAKLKQCHPDVKDFVLALHSEVVKLHKLNVSHQVQNLSLKAHIKVLQDSLESLIGPTTLSDKEREDATNEALKLLQQADKDFKKRA
jgi:hypothetical protein